MRIQPNIEVKVEVHYLDIEGLRFAPKAGDPDRLAEFDMLYAQSRLTTDYDDLRAIYLTGMGRWLNLNGEPGKRRANIRFGSMGLLPEDWQQRVLNDLWTLAQKVQIGG